MKFLLLFFIIAFSINSKAQTDTFPFKYNFWEEEFEDYIKHKRQQSLYCIEALKHGGALLVRLETKQTKIDALKKLGFLSDAAYVEQKQKEENFKITKAFEDNYSFSKLYYFYSTETDSIKNGIRKGIFLNSDLEPDPTIELTENFYLIAELDNVEADPVGFPEKENLKNVPLRNQIMYGRALVIRDKYFIQLRKPFPFYVPAPKIDYMYNYVADLDRVLNSFYDKRLQPFIIYPNVTLFWFDKSTDKVQHYYLD